MIPTIDKNFVKKIIPERIPGHYYKKYTFGLMLVIGGSDFYSGSPALNAFAGFRAGIDMVRIFAPERAANIVSSFSPILAALPMKGNYLKKEHLSFLLYQVEIAKEVSRGKCSLVVGGGLGRTEETQKTVVEFLEKVDLPMVIDADAIYALSEKKNFFSGKKAVITPHLFEFFILTGQKIDDLKPEQKSEIVKKEAEKIGATIFLKSKPDIISDGKEVLWNERGSPYMSVGGTGDVLAGVCGAFLAQNIDPLRAVAAAGYLTCRAGEIAGEKLEEGLTAFDVIEALPQAIKEIKEG